MQKYIIQDWYDLIGIYFIHLFLFVIFIILFHIFHSYIFSLLFIFFSISIYFIIRYKIIIYVFSFHFMQSIQNFNKENSVLNSFLHEELSGIVPPITNYQQDLHFVSGAYRFSWIRKSKAIQNDTYLPSKQTIQHLFWPGEEGISDAFWKFMTTHVDVGNDKWNRIAEKLLQLFPFNSSVKILPSPLSPCSLFFWPILLLIHRSTVYGNRRAVPLNCAG